MCFGRAFHLILMHLFCYIQCFEVRFQKFRFFSLKSCFFQNFDWSNLILINRNLTLKIMWASTWFDWSNLFFDQSNIVFQFFKNSSLTVSNILFKSFSTFSLFLSDLARLHSNLLSFSSSIFARFSSLKADKTILSLLLFLFSCFHAFKGYFRTSLNLGFLLIQFYFSEIDHWVLLVYCYIHDCCWLIWSIWGFMKNWKF